MSTILGTIMVLLIGLALTLILVGCVVVATTNIRKLIGRFELLVDCGIWLGIGYVIVHSFQLLFLFQDVGFSVKFDLASRGIKPIIAGLAFISFLMWKPKEELEAPLENPKARSARRRDWPVENSHPRNLSMCLRQSVQTI